jgi:hypothetical protein
MKVTRKPAFLLLIILFSLITGCVSVPAVFNGRDIADYTKDKKNEGLVIISGVVNTSEAGRLTYVKLQKLDNPDPKKLPPEYIIGDSFIDSTDISLFAKSIPEGRYKLLQLGFTSKYLDFSVKSPFSDIVIKANQTVDLGMLIVSAMSYNVIPGRSSKFLSNADLINQFAPNQELLKNAESGGWEDFSNKEKLAEVVALSQPQGITGITETPKGEIIAGTRMGTIIIRDLQKKWRIFSNTDNYSRIQLTAISPANQGNTIIAINEFGDAYHIEEKNSSRISLGNLPKGKPFFLSAAQDGSRWYAGIINKDQNELFTANKLDGNWEKIFSDKKYAYAYSGAQVWAAKLPNGLFYASAATPEIRCLDYSTGKWITSKAPKGNVILDIKVNSKTGSIGILTGPGGGFAGVFATAYFVKSCGNNWQEIKSPYTVHVGAPIIMNDGSIADIGGVFKDSGMYVSQDEGKTWNKATDRIIHVDKLYQTENHGLFVVSNASNGIETVSNSQDNGKTWSTELSSLIQGFKE